MANFLQSLLGLVAPHESSSAPKKLTAALPAPAQKMPYLDQTGQPMNQGFQFNPNGNYISGGGADAGIFNGDSQFGGLQVRPTVTAPAGAQWSGIQPSTSFDGNLQGYNQDDLSNGIQGGQVNQGFIPLQGSGSDPYSFIRQLLGR